VPAARPQAGPSDQQDTQQLQQQLTEQQQQVAGLVQQLTLSQADLSTSQHHLSALKQQLLSLQQQYDDTQQQVTTVQEELTRTRAELTSTRADLERMRRAAMMSISEGGGANGPANGPPSGTSSLPASRQQSFANLAALGSEEELRAEVVRLSHKVAALKASRDKLLSELDSHSEDINQLMTERYALQQELAEIREVAAKWEAQAQDSLLYIDRLKDLLEESAQWQPEAVLQAAGQAAAGGAHANGIATQTSSIGGEAQGDVYAALLKEQAHCAELEVQVRALCAELTRSHHAQQDIGRSLMPVLSGIENKLLQLHSVTRV
jgi:DNA repair exonuclease SbcCD ATPase subunit